MTNITRYYPSWDCYDSAYMEEDENGEYVKYKEYQEDVAELEKRIACLEKELLDE